MHPTTTTTFKSLVSKQKFESPKKKDKKSRHPKGLNKSKVREVAKQLAKKRHSPKKVKFRYKR